MKKRVTLTDIARLAGVSVMTVSRSLRDAEGVSPKLQLTIKKIARELNYIPQRSQYESNGESCPKTVGVLLPQLENTIFPKVLKNIETELSLYGYRVFFSCPYGDILTEFRNLEAILDSHPDGIIWSPVHITQSRKAAGLIKDADYPLVFLDRKIDGVKADAILVDDYEGMYAATKHLVEQGKRHFAFIAPREDSYVAVERLSGFRKALADTGIEFIEEHLVHVGADIVAGHEAVRLLMERGGEIDAYVCFNDPLAIGVEYELLERQVRIPHEAAIMGFSGIIETQIAQIPISTVFQDAELLGCAAAEFLLSRMTNPDIKLLPREKVIKTYPLLRASSLLS